MPEWLAAANTSLAGRATGDAGTQFAAQISIEDEVYRLVLADGVASIQPGAGEHDVAIAIQPQAAAAIRAGTQSVADAIRQGNVQLSGRPDLLAEAGRALAELLRATP